MRGQTGRLRGELGKSDPVNREHLNPDAALRCDRFLAEQVLGERQRHQLCASVTSSSAPAIWAPLVSPVVSGLTTTLAALRAQV
jgi:hypothetical protein